MSEKNLDHSGRWRSLTIAFRVSPEENEDIKRRVRLSGLTKQEYICRRCREQEIVVMGNPRVYKALKEQMREILDALQQHADNAPIDADLLATIRLIAVTLDGMKKEDTE